MRGTDKLRTPFCSTWKADGEPLLSLHASQLHVPGSTRAYIQSPIFPMHHMRAQCSYWTHVNIGHACFVVVVDHSHAII